MRTINVKLTKAENAAFYTVTVGDVVSMSLREYLHGVVASEMGSAYKEAYRAQAVASRTFVWQNVLSGEPISDSSANAQCFSVERAYSIAYEAAHKAVDDTEDEILCYNGKPLSPCSFSASNGGRTVSSESRWGGARSYLIEQDDPWDFAATKGNKTGHGVGMSQRGAQYAAKTGYSYRDILSFYYPGSVLTKEGSPMATVKASDLVKIFNQMANEKWKYVAGAHKQGEVDCSGAFYYAYKKLGGYMYHGSNTMWRKYTTATKGKIGEIELVPGMAVFKCRDWSSAHSSNGWYETEPGDVYHVGMYVGNGNVVEAQGTKTGVVITKVEKWHLAAQLKDTQYDLSEQKYEESFTAFLGEVRITGDWLNVRSGPGTHYSRELKAYNGDVLSIVGQTGDWYLVDKQGRTLYVSKQYIVGAPTCERIYTFSIKAVGDAQKLAFENMLKGYDYTVEEGVAA